MIKIDVIYINNLNKQQFYDKRIKNWLQNYEYTL